jgi:hypothetical protein
MADTLIRVVSLRESKVTMPLPQGAPFCRFSQSRGVSGTWAVSVASSKNL